MITVGKAPYRISLLGGGSDLDWFLNEETQGISLGYSLNKFTYSIVNVLDENSKSGILNYSVRENYTKIDSIVACNVLQTRLWKKEDYGFIPVNHNPVVLQQTQDLVEYYEENSLFYAFRADMFKKTNMRIGRSPNFYKTEFPENVDIDTEEDWSLVEKIAESN